MHLSHSIFLHSSLAGGGWTDGRTVRIEMVGMVDARRIQCAPDHHTDPDIAAADCEDCIGIQGATDTMAARLLDTD